MKPIYTKITAALAALGYIFYYQNQPYQSTIIDAFDLLMHEAGHWIFALFGEFMGFLGGSLMQILIPVIFIAYFWIKEQKFSAALLLYWLGINFINVSVYAADAFKMQLPLLGGDNAIHDWNWILGTLGLLRHAEQIAGIIKTLGWTAIIVALVLSIYYALAKDEKILYNIETSN